jgi:Protein of unknown function (DUF4058)
MALHEWTDRSGWEGLHIYWMTELARDLRTKLPSGYRAVIGSSPLVTIGETPVKPDVALTNGHHANSLAVATIRQPDWEAAVATLEEDTSVQIEKDGRLIAAIELVSPRNKDRPSAREQYVARYLSYLQAGVHVLLVDVHRRPLEFGFSQMIAAAFNAGLPRVPAPSAVSYRVGETAATGGRMLSVWHEALRVGEPLPAMPLALADELAVSVELDATYSKAAADCYL